MKMSKYLFTRALVLIYATASFCYAVAAEKLSESEAILAGFVKLDDPSKFPDHLEIPQGWLSGIREMAARTAQNNLEVGACLEVKTPDEIKEATESAMTRYQALLMKRKSMDEDDFRTQEALLRKDIQKKGSFEQGQARQWEVGKIQGGGQSSVRIEISGLTCEGASVGNVHTHPYDIGDTGKKKYLTYPSDGDFSNSLSTQKINLVIGGDDICALIPGAKKLQYSDAMNIYRTTLTGLLWSGISKDELFQTAVSTAAASAGSSLYCGRIGQTLRKSSVSNIDFHDSPIFILAAKAWVVAMRQQYYPEWKTIDFQFKPVLEDEFIQYIYSIYGEKANLVDWRKLRALSVYLEITSKILPPHERFLGPGIVGFGDGFSVPDARFTDGSFFQFSCDLEQKGVEQERACALVENRRVGQKKLRTLYAGYRSDESQWFFTQKANGTFSGVWDYPRSGIRKEGEVERDESTGLWVMNGLGVSETKDYRYEGAFKNSQPYGSGKIFMKMEQRWYKATADSDRIMKGDLLK